jgi:hypothetical protein
MEKKRKIKIDCGGRCKPALCVVFGLCDVRCWWCLCFVFSHSPLHKAAMPCYNLHELDSSLYKRGEVLVAPQELEQRTRSVLTPVATDELANDLAMVMAHLHTLPALEVIQLTGSRPRKSERRPRLLRPWRRPRRPRRRPRRQLQKINPLWYSSPFTSPHSPPPCRKNIYIDAVRSWLDLGMQLRHAPCSASSAASTKLTQISNSNI